MERIGRAIAAPLLAAGLIFSAPWIPTAQAAVTALSRADAPKGRPAPLAPVFCEHRTASHLAEHGGKAADDAYHVSRGELPNCDEPASDSRKDNDQGDEGKSRYCRRHFFC